MATRKPGTTKIRPGKAKSVPRNNPAGRGRASKAELSEEELKKVTGGLARTGGAT